MLGKSRGHDVQVHETEEVMLFKKCGPREYGERIWQSVASNAIMTPLEGLVEADLLNGAIKVEYLERTAELAEPWVVAEGIKNPYTMLWVTARKYYLLQRACAGGGGGALPNIPQSNFAENNLGVSVRMPTLRSDSVP